MAQNHPHPTRPDRAPYVGIGGLAGLCYVLSYARLRALAWSVTNETWQADTWPLALDLFDLIAGYIALVAARRRQPDRYASGLAVAYAALVIGGNAIDPTGMTGWAETLAGVAVHGLPALTLVLGWHLILRRAIGHDRPQADTAPPAIAPDTDAGHDRPSDATMAGPVAGRDRPRLPAVTGHRRPRPAATDSLAATVQLVRAAQHSGQAVTVGDVQRATGRGDRQARRLLAQARAEMRPVVAK